MPTDSFFLYLNRTCQDMTQNNMGNWTYPAVEVSRSGQRSSDPRVAVVGDRALAWGVGRALGDADGGLAVQQQLRDGSGRGLRHAAAARCT